MCWWYLAGCVIAWVLIVRVLDGTDWFRADWEDITWDYYFVVGLIALCAAAMWPLVLGILLFIGATMVVSNVMRR